VQEDKYGGYTYPDQIPGTFLAVENKDNDYLIDRVAQKNYSYTGIKAFPVQDLALVEDQWGPRADRSLESLVTADQNIIAVRKRLIDAAVALMEGQEPSGPSNPDTYRVHTARMTVPNTMPIPEAVEQAKKQTSGVTSSTVTST
jgi:phthalate 4,5-dioxygenase oxygenase subunit